MNAMLDAMIVVTRIHGAAREGDGAEQGAAPMTAVSQGAAAYVLIGEFRLKWFSDRLRAGRTSSSLKPHTAILSGSRCARRFETDPRSAMRAPRPGRRRRAASRCR